MSRFPAQDPGRFIGIFRAGAVRVYDEKNIPLGVHGKNGFYQGLKRMQNGRPVIIQGDGTSLWHLTFNEDFAIGYTGLIGNRHAIGEAFHITCDEVPYRGRSGDPFTERVMKHRRVFAGSVQNG
ncbi:MAG: hypothetical protein IKE35_04140, partial [Lachnospiraceae bacterium]|nr:hypothetical protein [Lachnospiraceae bacterium]